MSQNLQLKWGTLKGWDNLKAPAIEIVKRFFGEEGASFSCMTDRPDDARKEILCELIDHVDGSIYNCWSGKEMSKDEAKIYIREYGKTK